jgi:ubiquitin C-terminal hydrolase
LVDQKTTTTSTSAATTSLNKNELNTSSSEQSHISETTVTNSSNFSLPQHTSNSQTAHICDNKTNEITSSIDPHATNTQIHFPQDSRKIDPEITRTCSIMNSIYEFTALEILQGDNSFGCYHCTKLHLVKISHQLEFETVLFMIIDLSFDEVTTRKRYHRAGLSTWR